MPGKRGGSAVRGGRRPKRAISQELKGRIQKAPKRKPATKRTSKGK